MSLQYDLNQLREEYGLDEKESETYFKPDLNISNDSKEKVKQQFGVFLKNVGNKIRVSGKDKDTRRKAISYLLQSNKKEEEDFFEEDYSDNIELISKLAESPSDEKNKTTKTQPQKEVLTQPSSNPTDEKKLEEVSPDNQNSNQKQNHNRFNRNNNQNRNHQQNRNNQPNRYNQQNQPRRTNSTPNENNQGYKPNRNRSDGPQQEHKRVPTSNYTRIQNRKNLNNQNGNERLEQNNENKVENPRNEENGDNGTPQTNEPRNERGRGRGGRGRGGRGGRGRGGRGGRGRGGRSGRAPLGPRASVLDDMEQKERPPFNNGDAPIANNQQRQHQGNRRYNNNNNNQYRGGNQRNRGGRGGNRGGRFNMNQNQQPLPPEHENAQINQQPISPDDISYKEEIPQEQTIQITPEIKHILMLMDNLITPETTEQEILSTSWLHLEKLINPLNEENKQPGTLMNAPYLLVEFLIESFAIDQPEQFQHIEHKNFQNKQLMHLSMPFLMPLTFQTEGDKIQVGFFSLPDFSSDDMNELCSTVLTTLSQRNMLSISINEVDKTFSFSYLEELSKELDFVYLRSSPQENEEMETISFTIKIMIYNWSPEKELAILGRISEMFKNSSIYECSKCGCTYSPLDDSKCYLTKHKGRQIPFPDSGQMEVVEYDEETGQAVVYVNYECCGEVEQDEPGCETTQIENGSHEPYGETSSTMSVETLPIYS